MMKTPRAKERESLVNWKQHALTTKFFTTKWNAFGSAGADPKSLN